MKKSVQIVKSRGTIIAEKARAKANKYTDQKRSALLEKGMSIIYGGSTMPNLPLIAVDTNVLIDLAEADEVVTDCFSTIRRKFPNAPIIVPPTVIGELADIASDGDNKSEKESALKALRNIRSTWGFHPMNYVPVGHGIVEETARKIRAAGLIPQEEIHDSFVIAESALANVTLLLSSDGHMKDINQSVLGEVLEECDVGKLIIFSPAKIVRDFFNSVH